MEMGIEFPPHAHVGQGKRGVRVDKELPALPVPVPRGGGNMYAYAHTPHTQTRTQTQNQKQGMRGSYGPRQRASGYRVHPQTHTHGRNYADEKYRDSTHTHTQKQTQKRKSKLLGFVEKIIGALFGENDRRGNKKGKKTSEKWVR